MNTETPGFHVNPHELIFERDKSSNQSFSIAKIGLSPQYVELSHNLPRCFKIRSERFMPLPNDVKVEFDHRVKLDNGEFPELMHIKLQNIFNWDLSFEVTVKFSDENKTRNETGKRNNLLRFGEWIPVAGPSEPAQPVETRSDALECKVCLVQYSDNDEELIPRMLPACGHTLCQKCVEHIKTPSGQVLCPFDRKRSLITNDVLPKNFTIIELLQEKNDSERRAKIPATELSDDPDIPCYENPRHEALYYCPSCDADFCPSCFFSTHNGRIFSGHKFVPVEDKPMKSPNCVLHPTSVAHYMCKDKSCQLESKLFCNECRRKEHKSHEHVNLAEQITNNQSELHELIQTLKSSEITLEMKLENVEKCAESYETTNPAYAREVESVTRFYDEKKKEALNRLKEYVETEKGKLLMERDDVQYQIKMMAYSRKEMERTLKQRKNLYDVKEILERGQALTAVEAGSAERLVPFGTPTDRKIDYIREVIYKDPAGEPFENRPIAIATRKRQAQHLQYSDASSWQKLFSLLGK